jgi:hypothetical protein
MGAGPELGRLLEALSRERAFGRLPAATADALSGQQRRQVLIAAERWRNANGAPT